MSNYVPGSSTGAGPTVAGWGAVLPPGLLTNDELARRFDVDASWISARTGIERRHVGGTTATLAAEAARRALDRAGVGPEEVDALILATTTPDMTLPPTAAEVGERLGTTAAALDLNAACSGYIYALVHAFGLMRLGAETVLVVGAETMRRVTDEEDRDTAILFGDGAGALVLRGSGRNGRVLGFDLGNDPSGRHLLTAPIGGTMAMDGREIFRRAIRAMVDTATTTLGRAGRTIDDVALVVPHQANIRILEAAAERLGIGMDRVATVLHETGNTSSASIPLTLVDAIERGRIHDGDLVLFVGFGAGMSWASLALEWSGDPLDAS